MKAWFSMIEISEGGDLESRDLEILGCRQRDEGDKIVGGRWRVDVLETIGKQRVAIEELMMWSGSGVVGFARFNGKKRKEVTEGVG